MPRTMRTIQEIRIDIRAIKREMRAKGVRRISCFNGGLSADERAFNSQLFNLETELKTVAAWNDRNSVSR